MDKRKDGVFRPFSYICGMKKFLIPLLLLLFFPFKCEREEKYKNDVIDYHRVKHMTREQIIERFEYNPDTVDWDRFDKELNDFLNSDKQKQFEDAKKWRDDYRRKIEKESKRKNEQPD